jgi:hypothetical protein
MIKLLFILFFFGSLNLNGQDLDAQYIDKVKSQDAIIATLYGVISGEKGEERNWELMKYLFHPDARLIPSGKNQNTGLIDARYLTVDDYISSSGKWLIENGFYEIELHREVHTFGNISQAFSSYESYRSKSDTKPFMRGINSIQMLNDGNRWWIINIYWMQESAENPIPKKYLPAN